MNLAQSEPLDISVVVPVRNAAGMIEVCLQAVRRNRPREIIVVDGLSEDDTMSLARRNADVILSDGGEGVSYARQMGAEAASCPYVAFVDVDVELPEGALGELLDELREMDTQGIQAGLRSLDADDYWSRALATHHNRGVSRNWFGLSATLFVRDTVLRNRFDPSFRSGEDIEIRHRLRKANVRVAVSEKVIVVHKFESGFQFARDQFLADGAGLGRMARKYGWRVFGLLMMPAVGAVLGVVRSLRRGVINVPYYITYFFFNYVGILRGLLDSRVRPIKSSGR